MLEFARTGRWRRIIEMLLPALLLLPFAILVHEPRGCVKDDEMQTRLIRSWHEQGTLRLPYYRAPGSPLTANQFIHADGMMGSSLPIGITLWGLPFYHLGRMVDEVAGFPWPNMMLRQTNWAYLFVRMLSAVLICAAYPMLLYLARLFRFPRLLRHVYAVSVIFGTQWLLLFHLTSNHCLSGFGLLVAFTAAFSWRKSASLKAAVAVGTGLCIAITSRTPSLMYVPIILGWMFIACFRSRFPHPKQVRPWPGLRVALLLVLLGLLVNAWYDRERFGRIFNPGYRPEVIIIGNPFKILMRYLFSIDESFIINCPLVILSGLVIYRWLSSSARSGLWLKLQKLRSTPAGEASIVAALLCAGHIGFYLLWGYNGGMIGLRFMSEVFFLLLLPAVHLLRRRDRIVYTTFALLVFLPALANAVRSVMDYKYYWMRPRPLNENPLAGADPIHQLSTWDLPDYLTFANLWYSWRVGSPAWFGWLAWGTAGIVLPLIAYAAVAVFFATRRSLTGRVCMAVASLCALHLLVGLAFAIAPPQSAVNYSTPHTTVKNLAAEFRRGVLRVTGKVQTDGSDPATTCAITLRYVGDPPFQHVVEAPFVFDPPSNNLTDVSAGLWYNYSAQHDLPAHLPAGEYEADFALGKETRLTSLGVVSVTRKPPLLSKKLIIHPDEFVSSATGTDAFAIMQRGQPVAFAVTIPDYPFTKLRVRPVLAPLQESQAGARVLLTEKSGISQQMLIKDISTFGFLLDQEPGQMVFSLGLLSRLPISTRVYSIIVEAVFEEWNFELPADGAAGADTPIIGDFDEDGLEDVVVSGRGELAFYRGDGVGGLNHEATTQTLYAHSSSIGATDTDRDGKLDLLIAGGHDLQMLKGLGNGHFADAIFISSGFAPHLNPAYSAFGDYNGDGLLDVALSTANEGRLRVMFANGNGTFRSVGPTFLPLYGARITAGDINRDGKTDVLLTAGTAFAAAISDGIGSFTPIMTHLGFSAGTSVIGDITGDGKADAVVNGAQRVAFKGNGDGTFTRLSVLHAVKVPVQQIVDINQDGKLDLFGRSSSGVAYALNERGGSFSAQVNVPASDQPASVVIGNLTADTKPDIVTVDEDGVPLIVNP